MRLTKTENLHVTLLFLGRTEEKDIPEICKGIEEAVGNTPAFAMNFTEIKTIRRRGVPAMLWADFKQNPSFEKLAIKTALALTGEERHQTAHVTLARIRKGYRLQLPEVSLSNIQLPVSRVELWESKLSPKGAEYIVLEEFFLKK